MPSISIFNLIGGRSLKDYQDVMGDGNADDALSISRALTHIATQSDSPGLVLLPPGDYRAWTQSVELVSNLVLSGFGRLSRIVLGNSRGWDVVVLSGLSNVVLRDLRIDGNRTNNATGTRHGLYLYQCSDIWLTNLEVHSAIFDGIHILDCDRVKLAGCRVHDNGRHGLNIVNSRGVKVDNPEVYDNCQVTAAGDADNIRLELLSSDCTLIAADCYATALIGGPTGYGVREAPGELVERTVIIGGHMRGNLSGTYYLEDQTSVALGA